MLKKKKSYYTHPLHVMLLVLTVLASQQTKVHSLLIFNFHLIYGRERTIMREQQSLSSEAREFETLATA